MGGPMGLAGVPWVLYHTLCLCTASAIGNGLLDAAYRAIGCPSELQKTLLRCSVQGTARLYDIAAVDTDRWITWVKQGELAIAAGGNHKVEYPVRLTGQLPTAVPPRNYVSMHILHRI